LRSILAGEQPHDDEAVAALAHDGLVESPPVVSGA
jgi:hypothetical protein